MFLTQNSKVPLKNETFKNPPSQYRAMPFWGWNCDLKEDELIRQIDCLKQMGFGGFYIHTRNGLATDYLGKEYMNFVSACADKAESEGMYACLYDEDRWPSGYGGGYVTANPEYRERSLLFTTQMQNDAVCRQDAIKNGGTYFLSLYDICLNVSGELESYNIISDPADAVGTAWYAYVVTTPSDEFYHIGGTRADVFNPDAVRRFIELTHEAYKDAVGDKFGSVCPTIFTDEPNKNSVGRLPHAKSNSDIRLAWTPDFDKTYFDAYGRDIIPGLPELIWELPSAAASKTRYNYYNHLCDRFTFSFCRTISDWCRQNNILFTGHFQAEIGLAAQSSCIGEVMRGYTHFDIPGIDMLGGNMEYVTAKQVQSVARQCAKQGVMSELYGVTNWDFDFRGHKFHGDWQSAMGVTHRVVHHALVSLKASAKRDYPASINYQSPWYKEYPYIENHFARLNTVLTRGKSCVSVGVIHPVESFWLRRGPLAETNSVCNRLESDFQNIVFSLITAPLDFDLISESTLPDLCTDIDRYLTVGAMKYSTIVCPECVTLRTTTLNILEKFIKNGGNVIFMGKCPQYADAVKSDFPQRVYDSARIIPNCVDILTEELKNEQVINITLKNGCPAGKYIYQLREEENTKWLFVANADPNAGPKTDTSVVPCDLIIQVRGEYSPLVYDTLIGQISDVDYVTENGYTLVRRTMYPHDSLLLRLDPPAEVFHETKKEACDIIGQTDFKQKIQYIREEENVCLMDIASFSIDGGETQPAEEILRIDRKARTQLGMNMTPYIGSERQPWTVKSSGQMHYVDLFFEIYSAEDIDDTHFCAESLEALRLNGEEFELTKDGYYIDKSISRYRLGTLKKGKNIITARVPLSELDFIEPCYLTGEFDVRLEGCTKTLLAPSDKTGFGDVSAYGMPFYGGNIIYRLTLDVPEDCDVRITADKYEGSLMDVSLDGVKKGKIVFSPYELTIADVSRGEHTLDIRLFGNRHNTLGALHNCGNDKWYHPGYWYSKGSSWSYEYNLKRFGILKSPVITYTKIKEEQK